MKERPASLSLKERKKLFLTLVEAQDRGMTVAQSRKAVADGYGVSERLVEEIEQEGLDRDWPLL
jgi:hypothetical protein